MNKIHGLFEIHITFDNTEHSVYNAINLVRSYPEKNLKLVFAVSSTGIHPSQLMISKWKSGTADNVISDAIELSKFIESVADIKVIRTKVESMASNEGVPVSNVELDEYEKNITSPLNTPYFEYHAKINLNSKKINDLEYLICDIKNELSLSTKIGISINAFGKRLPLLTLRMYDVGFKEADVIKNYILDKHIKAYGYTIDGCIQREFSVYDDNKVIDLEWLE